MATRGIKTAIETPEATDTVDPAVEDVTDPDGLVWKYVGKCSVCGIKLYHPQGKPEATSWVNKQSVVYLAAGGMTCVEHDPYAKNRFAGVPQRRIDGLLVNPIPGDQWTPGGTNIDA